MGLVGPALDATVGACRKGDRCLRYGNPEHHALRAGAVVDGSVLARASPALKCKLVQLLRAARGRLQRSRRLARAPCRRLVGIGEQAALRQVHHLPATVGSATRRAHRTWRLRPLPPLALKLEANTGAFLRKVDGAAPPHSLHDNALQIAAPRQRARTLEHRDGSLGVDTSDLSERQRGIAIRPGMQAEVELHTGSKTVLQYLLKPLYKSREAFREP